MSVLASTWAWQQQIPPNQKLVLVALADHAHDDGRGAYPSKELLARKTGYSERQVQRNLRDLREAGVIYVVRAATKHRPTEYGLAIGEVFSVTREDILTPLDPVADDSPGETDGARNDVADVSLTVKGTINEPSSPASADAERRTPNAGDLVAAWFEGAKLREAEEGVAPFPTIVKRMKGQAANMAKDLRTQGDWDAAVRAAYYAGCQGLWDLAQAVPVTRKSKFVDEKTAVQDAIFGPSAERARQRAAERATQGS